MLARHVEPPEFVRGDVDPYDVYIPYLGRKALVLQEAHHTEAHVLDTVDAFLEEYPEFVRLREDEQMWDDTGFWSARLDKDNYFGLARKTAELLLHDVPDCELALILANQMNMFAFTTQSGQKGTWVDVYLNDSYLPFAELRRAVHLTIDTLGDWKRGEYRIEDSGDILTARATRNVVGRGPPPSETHPVAVVGAPIGTFHSAVFEWKFGKTPWTVFDSLSYVLAAHDGPYWLDTDFTSDRKFELGTFHPYSLRDCIVLECALTRAELIPWESE